MAIDPIKAAEAYSMVHDRRLTMAQVAKALKCGTLDVGDMLIAHKRVLDAREKEWAAKAGEGAAGHLNDVTGFEEAHRQRALLKARVLLAQGVDASAICERLGLHGSAVGALPEAKAKAVGLELKRAADRQVKRATAKVKFGHNGIQWTPVERDSRLAALREQRIRDGWAR